MPQNVETMTDQQLVVELMAENMLLQYEEDAGRVSELDAEIVRRFGAGATDRLADKVTGYKMTSTEAVLWAATGWEDCHLWLTGQRDHDHPDTQLGRSAWVVVRSHPGMPFSETDQRRSGYNSTPCPLEEAENAVGSVGDENVYDGIASITEAFRIAVENHPDRDGDTDIAAYIVDENDGTYTVAV